MSNYTPSDFSTLVLEDLNQRDPKIDVTNENVDNMDLWLSQEQNTSTWAADEDNPLGVRNSPSGSVEPYPSFEAGAQGTANTLENGYYSGILSSLESNADTVDFAKSVIDSPWSGHTYQERGLNTFLDQHSLDPAAAGDPQFAEQSGAGAAGPAAAGGSTGAGSGASTSANATTAGVNLNPLNLFGLGGDLFSGFETFLAKSFFALCGLALIGVGIYKLTAGPVINRIAPAAAGAAELGAA